MERAEVERLFEQVFDEALLTHGFADLARDYEMLFEGAGGELLRYVFHHCVAARVATALSPETWTRSLGDELLDPRAEPDGYVWGVRWQCMHPGATVVEASEEAQRWSSAVGVPFSHVQVETSVHVIDLVFTSISVTAP